MKNRRKYLMAVLAVLGLGVGLVGMTQVTRTTTASASVKKLSLKQAVKLTNHYHMLGNWAKLKINNKGKIAKNDDFSAGAKHYKKGWKIGYVGLVGGYRANLKIVPISHNRVKGSLQDWQSISPKIYKHHFNVARKLPKKVWHKGFPKFLRHKTFYANIYSKKGIAGYAFFAFRKIGLSEGMSQAGDTGLSGVYYKKRGRNYYLKGKIESPDPKEKMHTYKIHRESSKSFTTTSLTAFRGKKAQTYHYATHAPKINW